MLPADDTVRSYHDSYVYDDNTGGQLINVTRQSNKFDTNNSGNAGNEFSQVFNKELNYDDQNRLIEEITTLNAALTTGTDIPTNNDIAQYVTQYFYDKNHNRLKQVIYAGNYSIENRYTQYGALEKQVDVSTGFDFK